MRGRSHSAGGSKVQTKTLNDIFVGKRIRLRRKMLKMSQKELAHALNVSYQQVQKYETGLNRVAAG
ncbi:helix-turn-helix domain-containing protein, partial [Bartonella birtlesii]